MSGRLPDVVLVLALMQSALIVAAVLVLMTATSGRIRTWYWISCTTLWIAWVLVR